MFRKKSVDTITAALSRMVSDLQAHADEQINKAHAHEAESSRRMQLAYEHRVEVERARKAAEKISNLVS